MNILSPNNSSLTKIIRCIIFISIKNIEKNGIITFRVSIVVRRFAELPRIKKNQSQLGDFVASLVLLVCLAQCTKTPIVCIDADLRRQSCCGRESLGVCFNQINRPQKLLQKYINSKTQTQKSCFGRASSRCLC